MCCCLCHCAQQNIQSSLSLIFWKWSDSLMCLWVHLKCLTFVWTVVSDIKRWAAEPLKEYLLLEIVLGSDSFRGGESAPKSDWATYFRGVVFVAQFFLLVNTLRFFHLPHHFTRDNHQNPHLFCYLKAVPIGSPFTAEIQQKSKNRPLEQFRAAVMKCALVLLFWRLHCNPRGDEDTFERKLWGNSVSMLLLALWRIKVVFVLKATVND